MQQLLEEVVELGWDDALRSFTREVLSGGLRAPAASIWGRAANKVTGATWEDTLQDMIDPTRAGWMFLLGLQPTARVLFLGPSWGAAPVALARSVGHVVVLDGALERLRLDRHQLLGRGLEHASFARVVDPVHLPLADASVDLVVAPGLDAWFAAVGGDRRLPSDAVSALLAEVRRVLAPRGQAYIGTENRQGPTRLLRGIRSAPGSLSRAAVRREAARAGFVRSTLFAPIPFQHKFHQVLDLERSDRMNFSADPYRTRGRAVRPLIRAWDALNNGGTLERRLYRYLPGLSAVLSTDVAAGSFAERLLNHLGAKGVLGAADRGLARYFVRPKGVAVLGTGTPGEGGVVIRLPLEERAEATCARHHQALETLANDARIPAAVRALFPAPVARGYLDGQAFFAETAVAGESGRLYYSRPERRYDRAITDAADVLCQLRRATEEPVTIDRPEFNRLCGDFLAQLGGLVKDDGREALDAVARWLEATLIGRTLPLGWSHGDYDLANLFYGPDDRVSGILDFEVFDPRGLPLIDLLLLLARRSIRRHGVAFGTLFTRVILSRTLPPLEAELFEREFRAVGADERLYRALAICGWLNHLRLRRDSWLVRSPSWLDANLHAVVATVRRVL
jgi:aminoglycoside phosphotransferase (APT) family kinase protein/SAM-dependent methyltransferase